MRLETLAVTQVTWARNLNYILHCCMGSLKAKFSSRRSHKPVSQTEEDKAQRERRTKVDNSRSNKLLTLFSEKQPECSPKPVSSLVYKGNGTVDDLEGLKILLVVKAILDGRMQADACVGHSMRRGASNLALGWFLLTDPIPIFNGKQGQRLETREPPI